LGVVVCGEEFETQLDKRRAFRVDDDRADDAAFGVVDVVEVAELGAAESAAAAGFLPILYAMSALDWRDWYSLNVARMPCISWPTGVSSMASVAETR
jgi:hypothetical protein